MFRLDSPCGCVEAKVSADGIICRHGKPPVMPWEWNHLSRNTSITPEFVFANLDKEWSNYLSSNSSITSKLVLGSNISWSWSALSANKFAQSEMVRGRLLKQAEEEDIRISNTYSNLILFLISPLANIVMEYTFSHG